MEKSTPPDINEAAAPVAGPDNTENGAANSVAAAEIGVPQEGAPPPPMEGEAGQLQEESMAPDGSEESADAMDDHGEDAILESLSEEIETATEDGGEALGTHAGSLDQAPDAEPGGQEAEAWHEPDDEHAAEASVYADDPAASDATLSEVAIPDTDEDSADNGENPEDSVTDTGSEAPAGSDTVTQTEDEPNGELAGEADEPNAPGIGEEKAPPEPEERDTIATESLPEETPQDTVEAPEELPAGGDAESDMEATPLPTPIEPPRQDPVESEMNYKRLEKCLKRACVAGWSGIMRVHEGDNQVGAIIMRSGEIAWAVYNKQNETLGTFLVREGEITREQLADLQKKYIALKKTKKLGTLLEESGIITRTRLKHFLRIHIRTALKLMLEQPAYYCISTGGNMQVDEDLTFSWKDLFFSDVHHDAPIPRLLNSNLAIQVTSSSSTETNHFLRKFATLIGYRFSFIARTDGKIITIHKKPEVSDTLISLNWIADIVSSFADARMGHVLETDIKTDESVFLINFISASREFILCVSLDNSGRLGVAKHLIAKEIKTIEHFINAIR